MQRHLVVRDRPVHPHVGEDEALLVRLAGETDSAQLTHRAVHAVGADGDRLTLSQVSGWGGTGVLACSQDLDHDVAPGAARDLLAVAPEHFDRPAADRAQAEEPYVDGFH